MLTKFHLFDLIKYGIIFQLAAKNVLFVTLHFKPKFIEVELKVGEG